jgi:ACS family hexuronate transporter-like MFS transporter
MITARPQSQQPGGASGLGPAGRQLHHLRWWIVGLVALATVINYIHRNALGIMWPEIDKELRLSKEQYALIANSFMFAYALSQMLSGRLYDIVGTRIGFVISIVVWSVSAGLHGMARGVMSFGIFRTMLGLGEAGNWPGAAKANAEWFPIKERAFAQGIFNAGAALGAVISAPVIGVLYTRLGWQTTFYAISALGLLWIAPWLIMNRALPESHPWITPEEKQKILSGQQTGKSAAPAGNLSRQEASPGWLEMLSYRQTWSVVVSRFFLDNIWWFFINWLPIYLAEIFGFQIMKIAAYAWIPYFGAAAGSLSGGWWAGHLIGRGWNVNKARKAAILLGAVIMLPSLLGAAFLTRQVMLHPEVSREQSALALVTLMALVLFGFQVTMNNIQTLPSDYFSGKAVGSVSGLGGTGAALGVMISTFFIARLPFNLVLGFISATVPLGVLAIYLLGGTIGRVQVRSRTGQ